ncbi:MAG: FAD:protein FMN transferase [Steroidobacteraceae bacterium]
MTRSEHASFDMQLLEGRISGQQVWRGVFTAMANPCELLLETQDAALAKRLTTLAAQEALRIERKFSRYRDDSVVHAINTSGGKPLAVDAETAHLLDYGQVLWRLSDGAFDLTSGALRRIWKFGEQSTTPTAKQIEETLMQIGWQRVRWQAPMLALPDGMELDFGGIGKEYAVDRVAEMLGKQASLPLLINFGGDLRAIGPAPAAGAWRVGIESIAQQDHAHKMLQLRAGALATSGDTRRVIEQGGRRYGHIIDARTGWPAQGAPRSITVVADTCTQAGTYTTLAMLQGAQAEAFLDNESVRYWCLR